jgi:ACS family sodium-dependent inorganic phosphate cotransporter
MYLVAASSLGAAITMPVCGFLISSLGWESVFYVTGVVGLVWSIAWFFLVFDSPAQHPRISEEERRYIEGAIGDATSHDKVQGAQK